LPFKSKIKENRYNLDKRVKVTFEILTKPIKGEGVLLISFPP